MNDHNQNRVLIAIAKIIRRFFYIFLDVSGILLGVFLIILGGSMTAGWHVPRSIGWFTLVIGILAFIIHVGHYFSLKITRWLFGTDSYFLTQSSEFKNDEKNKKF